MKELIDFATQIGSLKQVDRAGWKRYGIDHPESVADHTMRCVILALTLPTGIEVNRLKVAQLMAIHDLPESNPSVGDITPHDGISVAEKFERERSAMADLCALLPNGRDLYELWLEYEAKETDESRIAHDLDKLEMAMQAAEYERLHSMDLTEFFESAQVKIRHPVLQKILSELMEKRGK
jgi:putative hydrolase of HD superfamily